MYKERLTRPQTVTHAHKHVGVHEFAYVTIAFAPRDEGVAFADESGIEDELVRAVEKALGAAKGPAGHQMTGFDARLLEGRVHPMDSTPRAFAIAALGAFARLETEIVEVWLRVEVTGVEDFIAGVIGDLYSRGARIVESDGESVVAFAPAGNLEGYETALRSMTRDRARCALSFSHCKTIDTPDPRFPGAAAMRA